jgi:hypothetical protein
MGRCASVRCSAATAHVEHRVGRRGRVSCRVLVVVEVLLQVLGWKIPSVHVMVVVCSEGLLIEHVMHVEISG